MFKSFIITILICSSLFGQYIWKEVVFPKDTGYISTYIEYGNGIWVSWIGNGRGIKISSDLNTWEVMPHCSNLIKYCAGRFVSVSKISSVKASVSTSIDARSWKNDTIDFVFKDPETGVSPFFNNISYGNGTIVIMNNNGATEISRDSGKTWINGWKVRYPAGLNWTGYAPFNSICYGVNKFIMVGYDKVMRSYVSMIYPDTTISKYWLGDNDGRAMGYDIVYGGDKFVSVGPAFIMDTNCTFPIRVLDKNGWYQPLPNLKKNISLTHICYGAGRYVATGTSNNPRISVPIDTLCVYFSYDGYKWECKNIKKVLGSSYIITSLVFGDNKFVGMTNDRMFVSDANDIPTPIKSIKPINYLTKKDVNGLFDIQGRSISCVGRGLYFTRSNNKIIRKLVIK